MLVALWRRTRNNQWRTCIINQYAIHLIHNGKVVAAGLNAIFIAARHVVAQVIKTKFVVGSVGNITVIGSATVFRIWLMLVNTINGQTVEVKDGCHPLTITLGEVIVHCYHVYPTSGQSIQIHRQGCHKGLTLTRLHFGNFSFVKHGTTNELYVVVHHVPGNVPTCGLPRIRVDHFIALDGNVVKFLGQFSVQIRRSSTHFTRRKSFRSFTHHCKSFRVHFE